MSSESLQKRKMLPPESGTNLKQMKQSCQDAGFGTTTSTGTGEKQDMTAGQKSSNGTRERLANAERQLAVVDKELHGRTSTRTRERLAEAERAKKRSATAKSRNVEGR